MALLLGRFIQLPAVDIEKGLRKGQLLWFLHRLDGRRCTIYHGKCSVVVGHTKKFVILLLSPHSEPTLKKANFNVSLTPYLE